MERCYNIKTCENATNRTMVSLTEDCIFVIHKDGSVEDKWTDNEEFIEIKLSTFQMVERMIEHDDACYNSVIKQSIPTDPALNKLCKLIDARMYGDYIVFPDYNNHYKIFEEYSKYLRNEESNCDNK